MTMKRKQAYESPILARIDVNAKDVLTTSMNSTNRTEWD